MNNGLNFKNMQTKIYKEDLGTQFGQWTDKTSKLMYYDSTVSILSKINTNEYNI